MIVNFYAAAADTAGAHSREVPGRLTVAELGRLLSTGNPALADVLARSTFLVDGRATHPDILIPASAQVDVLPPFAGG
jgi:molybdopterin synthase sulfur carrier subunit